MHPADYSGPSADAPRAAPAEARGLRAHRPMASHQPPLASLLVRGALAGALATLAMSAVMLVAGRLGIMGKQPPERIVEHGADAADVPVTEGAENVAASAAHVAFGAVAGAIFAPLARSLRAPTVELVAVPWALVVWAASYFGWVPALGILPPPTEDRPGRAWSMLAAHLVFGLALAGAWRVLRPGGSIGR